MYVKPTLIKIGNASRLILGGGNSILDADNENPMV